MLESIAILNYNHPRPQPVDPGVFFDLVKIRRLVDDATDLAVRAASGVASSAQSNPSNVPQHAAAMLGIGQGGAGQAKLSRERKFRMREQATQKLAKAYQTDEIASSVAAMQGTSTLEDVAMHVLQRSPQDPDAKYVHFFHEKIPSRRLAECTSLEPLDEVNIDRPGEGGFLRTRATVRLFKEDFDGAARDLTSALQIHRFHEQHVRPVVRDLELVQLRNGRKPDEVVLKEEDQPSSLESQLLFQRAGVYLTLACKTIPESLPAIPTTLDSPDGKENQAAAAPAGNPVAPAPPLGLGAPIPPGLNIKAGMSVSALDDMTGELVLDGFNALAAPLPKVPASELTAAQLEAQKIVRLNAKRALRDYTLYLSRFEYTPELAFEVVDEFARKVNYTANGMRPPRSSHTQSQKFEPTGAGDASSKTPRRVYKLSELFTATPPGDLPVLTPSMALAHANLPKSTTTVPVANIEALTYHPLLTDALHSLLLCHCLIQTSPKELKRHAHMVARLVRLADGYPIFQPSRSPARADWMDVLRRGDNWIQLDNSWETMCAPSILPPLAPDPDPKPGKRAPSGGAPAANPALLPWAAQKPPGKPSMSEESSMDEFRRYIRESVATDKTVRDRPSRAAAKPPPKPVSAAAAIAHNLSLVNISLNNNIDPATFGGEKKGSRPPGGGGGNRETAAAEEGHEYLIMTERASSVSRWVCEAPDHAGSAPGDGRRRKKKPAKKQRNGVPASADAEVAEAAGPNDVDDKDDADLDGGTP